MGGSAEYWNDAAQFKPGVDPLAFAVDGPRVRSLHLRLAQLGEADPTMIPPVFADLKRFAPPNALQRVEIEVKRVGESYAATVAHGWIKDWRFNEAPVVATFDADWIRERDDTSCVLQLPALMGSATDCALAVAMKQAGDRPVLLRRGLGTSPICDAGLETATSGSTVVEASGAYVDSAASQPRPGGPDLLRWSCDSRRLIHPVRSRLLMEFENAAPITPPPRLRDLRRTVDETGNCAANVVLVRDGGTSRRSFLLIVYGAVLGLGLGLVIQSLAAWLDRPNRGSRRRLA
jgi:hypothetical protein